MFRDFYPREKGKKRGKRGEERPVISKSISPTERKRKEKKGR